MKSFAASACRRPCSHWSLVFALLLPAFVIFHAAPLAAQEQACRTKSGPLHVVYPDTAKRMKIAGTVRLALRVTADGAVREVKVLGGNPLLVSAAEESVRKARFDSAESCVVTFEFKN